MTCNITIKNKNELLVSGSLTMPHVTQLLEQSRSLLKNTASDTIQIDLQDVSQCDSSGVALLIEWLREAKQQQRQIQFLRAPQQLRSLINVSGLQQLLPMSD